MFYVAEAFLLEEGVRFSRHSAVIASFGNLFARTERVPRRFHRYLVEAQSKRLIGDYDAESGVTEVEAKEQIGRAEEFIALADGMLGSLPADAQR